jgi:hypothetical protein
MSVLFLFFGNPFFFLFLVKHCHAKSRKQLKGRKLGSRSLVLLNFSGLQTRRSTWWGIMRTTRETKKKHPKKKRHKGKGGYLIVANAKRVKALYERGPIDLPSVGYNQSEQHGNNSADDGKEHSTK